MPGNAVSLLKSILTNLPEVVKPTQKRLSFREKLKWTGSVLMLFFVLGMIPLFGLGQNELQRFGLLSIILGAKFGSIISLGIGPIVTASIIIQLLTGSGLVKLDMTSKDGRKLFQGIQKAGSLAFILFEACIYVFMGGLSPMPGISPWVLIAQLCAGGLLILFMDEVVSKYGFGSGISLFIAAGVSEGIILRLFSPFTSSGVFFMGSGEAPVGAVWAIFHFLSIGAAKDVLTNLAAITATGLVFAIAVYTQAMRVELPMSFGRVRGHGIRWPLSFVYTSNIPVILVAALLANIQLWARLLQNKGMPILGTFVGNTPASGIVAWLQPPDLLRKLIERGVTLLDLGHSAVYIIFMIVGAVIFSIFWVQTSGMDARSQSQQMMSSGLQIPGFRRDPRVLEHLLNRYIWPLTVMGAITVGFLAATADLSGALSSGTGILLTVMIIYRLYEEIAQQHMMDMYPVMRRFIGG